jgi:phosphoadenosine phosphosulfate reductase
MPAETSFNAIVERYAGIEGRDLVAHVVKDYPGRVALLSSFGAESAVLLHMVADVAPDLPVLFLDTGKLFDETIAYRDQLVKTLGLRNLQVVSPDAADLARIDADGTLHSRDTDLCCHIRKTVPLARATEQFDVLISGRKRFHGAARSDLRFVSEQDGKLKIEPLAAFSALDLSNYVTAQQLPPHPLKSFGFHSIGCAPCTVAGGSEDDPRAGRWQGSEKTECGIHFSSNGTVIRTVSRATADAH